MWLLKFTGTSNLVTFLGKRDSVVLQEDDLEAISNIRVLVDNWERKRMGGREERLEGGRRERKWNKGGERGVGQRKDGRESEG